MTDEERNKEDELEEENLFEENMLQEAEEIKAAEKDNIKEK